LKHVYVYTHNCFCCAGVEPATYCSIVFRISDHCAIRSSFHGCAPFAYDGRLFECSFRTRSNIQNGVTTPANGKLKNKSSDTLKFHSHFFMYLYWTVLLWLYNHINMYSFIRHVIIHGGDAPIYKLLLGISTTKCPSIVKIC
jgi:hypothetical protein